MRLKDGWFFFMNAWFRYFLAKSIFQRKGRFILACSAVMLSVSVVTALLAVSLGVREKIGAELAQYGANMIVTGKDGGVMDDEIAKSISSVSPAVKNASFQVYGTAFSGDRSFEIVGIEINKMTGYRVYGSLPAAPLDAMAGVTIRDAFGVKQGDRLRFDGFGEDVAITGIFEKSPEEDATVVMPIDGAKRILKINGVSAVLLNAESARLKDIEQTVRGRWPSLDVKTIRQVAVAEERILGRIQLLMLLVTGVVLFSSVVALGSTMGANVIERMEEIGLMKALGATRGDIRRLFMLEAALAGFVGSLAGYAAGIIASEAVSKTAFGSFIFPNFFLAPAAVVVGVVIAVFATYFPVRDAMQVVPAVILRGE